MVIVTSSSERENRPLATDSVQKVLADTHIVIVTGQPPLHPTHGPRIQVGTGLRVPESRKGVARKLQLLAMPYKVGGREINPP